MNSSSISSFPASRTDPIAVLTAPQTRRGDSASAPSTPASRAPDRVELSDDARRAAEDARPVRMDIITRVREQIAKGGYESPDKIAIAAHEIAHALNERG